MQFSGLSVVQVDTPAVKTAFVSAVVASVDAVNVTAEITAIVSADSRRAGGTIVQYSVAAPAASMSALDMTDASKSDSFLSSFQQQLSASNDSSAQSLASADLSVQQIYPTAAPSHQPSSAPSYSPTMAPSFSPTEVGATNDPTSSPTFVPTTPAPTLNTDATLASLLLRYSSTGGIVNFSQSDSADGFSSTW